MLDLIYPAVSGSALVLLTALLLRRYGGRGWYLLIPAVVMVGSDYAENAVVWTLRLRWPEVDVTLAGIGGVATTVKFVAGFAAFSIPIVLLVAAIIQCGLSKPSSPPQHDAAGQRP